VTTTLRDKRINRHRRVRKRVAGSPDRPRLAVFRSNRHVYAQLIDDLAGRTLASASTLEAELKGAGNTTATAASVGRLLAKRAREKGISSAVFDRGGFLYHGKVQALADGAREEGLEF
jgi:large subunit ribosomal protein L18